MSVSEAALEAEAAVASFIVRAGKTLWPDDLKRLNAALDIIREHT